jgi:hypothetical protein
VLSLEGTTTLLDVSVSALMERLLALAENRAGWNPESNRADAILFELEFVGDSGDLTDAANEYYLSRWVLRKPRQSAEALATMLKDHMVPTTFCGPCGVLER